MYPYFSVFSYQIPAYGVMMGVGLFVAGGVALVRVQHAKLHWEDALVILACAFGFALLGAAGLYVLVTYSIRQIFEMIRTGELFQSNRMGLVFYGGLLLAIPGSWLGARLARTHLMDYVVPIVPCIPLGHAFGRIGCLLAGCCYGVPTNLPIGIAYTQNLSGAPLGVPLFPIQAIESAALVLVFIILIFYTRCVRKPMQVAMLYIMLYSPLRFILEWFRYDAIRGVYFGLSTSQWISIAIFIPAIVLFLISAKKSSGVCFDQNSVEN